MAAACLSTDNNSDWLSQNVLKDLIRPATSSQSRRFVLRAVTNLELPPWRAARPGLCGLGLPRGQRPEERPYPQVYPVYQSNHIPLLIQVGVNHWVHHWVKKLPNWVNNLTDTTIFLHNKSSIVRMPFRD